MGHVLLTKLLYQFVVWFGLVSLFNGISTFVGYLVPEEQLWYYLTRSWEDKEVHTFLESICPKRNVIARLEYELAYYNSAVHRFNHYTTMIPTLNLCRLFNAKAILPKEQ